MDDSSYQEKEGGRGEERGRERGREREGGSEREGEREGGRERKTKIIIDTIESDNIRVIHHGHCICFS